MDETQARAAAEEIADGLLVNGFGERAQRLVLTVDTPRRRDLGGWSRGPLVDRIECILLRRAEGQP